MPAEYKITCVNFLWLSPFSKGEAGVWSWSQPWRWESKLGAKGQICFVAGHFHWHAQPHNSHHVEFPKASIRLAIKYLEFAFLPMQIYSCKLNASLLIQVIGQMQVFFHLVTNEFPSCFNSSFTQSLYKLRIIWCGLLYKLWIIWCELLRRLGKRLYFFWVCVFSVHRGNTCFSVTVSINDGH